MLSDRKFARTNEITIRIGNEEQTIVLEPGFYNTHLFPSPLHKHGYTEIHLFIEGKSTYRIDGNEYTFLSGDIVAIPPGVYHEVVSSTEDVQHSGFYIDHPITGIQNLKLPSSIVSAYIKEHADTVSTGNHGRLLGYLSLFCSLLLSPPLTASPTEDHTFIITEFFAKNYYRSVHVEDLAKRLFVSNKQAERLVIKHTGYNFTQALTNYRMTIATYLLEENELSLSEIAHRVGYQSYSGFWKAWRKYQNKT